MASTASRIDIFNMALGFIGTRTIASASERTPEAVQCSLYWDRARRATLREYPYNFAVRRVIPAEKPLPPVYAREWLHAYALPDSCLRVLGVHDGRERGRKQPFSIEGGGEGALLLCNIPDAFVTCTCDVTDVALWDELFVMCMARKLAALIAVPLLKNNSGKIQELERLYRAALPESEGQSAGEGREEPRPDAWLAAREVW